jgi:Right handed beta helix region
MFRIVHHHDAATSNQTTGQLLFERGGGKQGGRNWCRCDQCTYAAPWCGQHQNPPDRSDDRLISGTWMVENVLAELDVPGEYFLDPTSHVLYIIPNRTVETTDTDHQSAHADASVHTTGLEGLRIAVLDELIRVQDGAKDITISTLGFRDTAATYMSDWIVPSGGDWSLHRGGAIYVEQADNITIQNCTFSRLDGNAIFVYGRTRSVTIRDSIFEWLGESAIALLGETDKFNATSRQFPMDTVIEYNVMRELGIYQKQSSAVFQSKAAKTTIQNNLMLNLPRAAINFNDMLGGGDIVDRNLIFNTCRESGDHGPINTWDRQPFLSDLRDGTPSFVPIRRVVANNLIFANYGASQGLDNDDGSSWYHVHHNVFYSANGFKMDYGGHDSIFEDNLVVGFPNKGMCVGFGSFFAGHEHVVRRNTCLSARSDVAIIQLDECVGSPAVLHDNRYLAPNASAKVQCGWSDDPIPFLEFQRLYGIEQNSTLAEIPSEASEVIQWAKEILALSLSADTAHSEHATSVS